MLKKLSKIIKKYKKLYLIPRTVFEANYPFLCLISIVGIFSFKTRKCNNKIYLLEDKKRTIISLFFVISLIYIFFDFMINRTIYFVGSMISRKIFYVIFLTQLGSGIISLLSFFPLNNTFLKVFIKVHLTAELVDQTVCKTDAQNVLSTMLKYNLFILITGIPTMSILCMFYALAITDELGSISDGLKVWFGYFLPFSQSVAMVYIYANMLYILRVRFCCLKNKLHNFNKMVVNDVNGLQKSSENVLKESISVLSNLMDLIEDINGDFGIAVTGCLFAFFIFLVVDIFTRLLSIVNFNSYVYSADMFFGAIYNILCQYCLFVLPYESGKLSEEVKLPSKNIK